MYKNHFYFWNSNWRYLMEFPNESRAFIFMWTNWWWCSYAFFIYIEDNLLLMFLKNFHSPSSSSSTPSSSSSCFSSKIRKKSIQKQKMLIEITSNSGSRPKPFYWKSLMRFSGEMIKSILSALLFVYKLCQHTWAKRRKKRMSETLKYKTFYTKITNDIYGKEFYRRKGKSRKKNEPTNGLAKVFSFFSEHFFLVGFSIRLIMRSVLQEYRFSRWECVFFFFISTVGNKIKIKK